METSMYDVSILTEDFDVPSQQSRTIYLYLYLLYIYCIYTHTSILPTGLVTALTCQNCVCHIVIYWCSTQQGLVKSHVWWSFVIGPQSPHAVVIALVIDQFCIYFCWLEVCYWELYSLHKSEWNGSFSIGFPMRKSFFGWMILPLNQANWVSSSL